MSIPTLVTLDEYLRIQTGRSDKLFGEVHVILPRDFYQIPPVAEESRALYKGHSVQWEALNAVIFLKTNHPFKNDLEYGELLERIAKREARRDDIAKINSRVITRNQNSIKKLKNLAFEHFLTHFKILH